jgi:hypothetical protein
VTLIYIEQQKAKDVTEKVNKDELKIDALQIDTLQNKYNQALQRQTLLEKNINGIFENSDLVNEDKKCVDISSNNRGAFKYLELVDLKKCNDIFTYDPINKKLLVKTNESTKCITSLNDRDIILNDCIKTFDKQQFDYFPMHDGKFHSSLYSKCLSYNKDSNIIELDDCTINNNIVKRTFNTKQQGTFTDDVDRQQGTFNTKQQGSNLFLPNS